MEWLSSVVKMYLTPGSMSFLLIGLLAGMLILTFSARLRRAATVWLALLVVLYWVLAMPVFAGMMERVLSAGFGRLGELDDAKGAQVVVVLSGGSASFTGDAGRIEGLSQATALRTLEGARLYHLLGDATVILSGGLPGEDPEATPEGVVMRQALADLGVPRERIVVEMSSEDTYDQAVLVGGLLRQQGIEEFVLVTSPWHMRRAQAVFEGQGLSPIPSVALGQRQGEADRLIPLLPSESALTQSQQMIREFLALAYYRLRGWI